MNPSQPKSSSRLERPVTRFREALAILSFLAALFLALSLFSYHPDDPCWSVSGASPIQNWLGAWGAQVADLSLMFFGLHSYLLVVVLSWLGMGMLLKSKFRFSIISFVGYAVFALLTAGLWHLWFGLMEGGHSSGGLWGMWLAQKLSTQTGMLGTSLLLLFGLLLATVWTTHFSISGWLMKLWMRIEPRARTQAMIWYERWLDWRDGWARWRWERQQRRMAKQEPQLAMADGYQSELPALELESSWLQRSHWDEGMRDQKQERPKVSMLPELTPPEVEAIRDNESLYSDDDYSAHDMGAEDSSEESAFWSDDHAAIEAQVKGGDATKDIRSHVRPNNSIPALESSVLEGAVYIPPTLDVGEERTVSLPDDDELAHAETPLAMVNPNQAADTSDVAVLSHWEQPLALYDWNAGQTVPEAEPFNPDGPSASLESQVSAPVAETAYPLEKGAVQEAVGWGEATADESIEPVMSHDVLEQHPVESAVEADIHPMLVDSSDSVPAMEEKLDIDSSEHAFPMDAPTVEEMHPDYIKEQDISEPLFVSEQSESIELVEAHREEEPEFSQDDDFVLVNTPLPDLVDSFEPPRPGERVTDSLLEESWFVESKEIGAQQASQQQAAEIVSPSPTTFGYDEEAELHEISEDVPPQPSEPVAGIEPVVQKKPAVVKPVAEAEQEILAVPESKPPKAKKSKKSKAATPAEEEKKPKKSKKTKAAKKSTAAPKLETAPGGSEKGRVWEPLEVPSALSEPELASVPVANESVEQEPVVEKAQPVIPSTTDSFEAFEPTEPKTQDLASRPSRSHVSLPASPKKEAKSSAPQSNSSIELASEVPESVEFSPSMEVSMEKLKQAKRNTSHGPVTESRPAPQSGSRSGEHASIVSSRFSDDCPLPAMDGLPSAPGVEVDDSRASMPAVPDSRPPVEEQVAAEQPVALEDAGEVSHKSPLARELLKRAMEDKRAQLEKEAQSQAEEDSSDSYVDEPSLHEEEIESSFVEESIHSVDESASMEATPTADDKDVDSYVEDSLEEEDDEVLQAAIDAMDEFEETGSQQGPLVHRRVRAKDPSELQKKKEVPAWRENGYEPPALELLDYKPPIVHDEMPEHLVENARVLERTLENFGVRGQVKEIVPGPVITIYEYLPEPGIKVSKIANLADDLAMALHAIRVRVIAPIPGKGVVGIEIPNKNREFVYLKEILADDKFVMSEAKLPMAIGKSTTGGPYVANLAKMPHLLIAGTTGSGKSVGVNGMICSLLFHCSPDEVRFLMVDPKMLELSIYDGIPHLLLPVVTDPKKASVALNWAVSEMERRYSLMAGAGVRNIANYNKLIEKRVEVRDKMAAHNNNWYEIQKAREAELENPEDFDWEEESEEFDLNALLPDQPSKDFYESLPYIVVVIDELADLMMVAAKEVEFAIARLAQMARAAGIHLLLATQRPSVDVLTGVIKANFPSRMAFQVKSKIDSRTILDQPGAERLLGAGDLLLMPPTSSIPIRLHGAYISEEEIHRVVKHLKKQGSPEYNEAILANTQEEMDFEEEPVDAMYDKAVEIVLRTRNASISYLQRKLRIGYNRSARIVEMMEREGLVGEQIGNKPREVLVPPPQD